MIRTFAVACGLLGAVFSAPAHAQERGDAARLDDFALPEAQQALRVEQLSDGESSDQPQQHVDRTLGRPVQSDPGGAMPAQLSSTGESGAVTQLPSTRQSRLSLGTAVSNTQDSAPGSVVRIGGQDRCDPQLSQKFYAACLRVLELRSDEFNAPQAPVLSAEQRLLAEQRQREEGSAETSTALRLRYATAMQPDADLQSNQELAAIYFGEPAPVPRDAPAETTDEPNLGEILQGLGITTIGPDSGP